MRNALRNRVPTCAACALLFVLPAAAPIASSLSPAGSLFCTTSDSAESKSGRTLSCAFKGISGRSGGLEGRIVLKGEEHLPFGKRVLVWSVLAPNADMPSAALAGRYVETRGGQLVGGKTGDIVLAPATRTERARDDAVTVLELHLDPTKA